MQDWLTWTLLTISSTGHTMVEQHLCEQHSPSGWLLSDFRSVHVHNSTKLCIFQHTPAVHQCVDLTSRSWLLFLRRETEVGGLVCVVPIRVALLRVLVTKGPTVASMVTDDPSNAWSLPLALQGIVCGGCCFGQRNPSSIAKYMCLYSYIPEPVLTSTSGLMPGSTLLPGGLC